MVQPLKRTPGIFQQPGWGASDRPTGLPLAVRRDARKNAQGELILINAPLFKGNGSLVPDKICQMDPLLKASRYKGKTKEQLVIESVMRGFGPKSMYGCDLRGWQEFPLVTSGNDRISIPRQCSIAKRSQMRNNCQPDSSHFERKPPPFRNYPGYTGNNFSNPDCVWFCDQRKMAQNAYNRYASRYGPTKC
jgi:hypothetical protein